jgi:hypothetical protein
MKSELTYDNRLCVHKQHARMEGALRHFIGVCSTQEDDNVSLS